jgi:hypothetical protein
MHVEFHLAQSRLEDLLANGIEQRLVESSLGLSGLIADVPFVTNLGDLLAGDFETTEAAIDHVRLTSVSVQRSAAIPAVINVPPFQALFGPLLPATTLPISVPSTAALVTIDAHLVSRSDLIVANGDDIHASRRMVVQVRARASIAPPSLAGSTLAIVATAQTLELGMSGIFVRLPSLEDREGLDDDAQLDLFRLTNRFLAAAPASSLRPLYAFMLRLNSAEVINSIPIPSIPLNLSGINALARSLSSADGATRIWNVGLQLSNRRVTLRLQFDGSDVIDSIVPMRRSLWLTDWTTFYATGSQDRLGGSSWALFVPSQLFTEKLHGDIVDGVESSSTGVSMSGGARPRSEWSVIGGVADGSGPCVTSSRVQVITRFAVFVPDVCEPWGLGVDVNVALTIVLSLSGQTLRADVRLDYAVDEGDLAACAILNSLLTGGGGVAIGGAIGGPIGAAIGGAVLGLGGGIATLVIGYVYDPGRLSLGSTLQPVPGSDRDFFMEFSLDADLSLSRARLEVQGMAGCTDGMSVRGNIAILQQELLRAGDLNAPTDDRGQRVNPFAWYATGNCVSDAEHRAVATFRWALIRDRAGFYDMPIRVFGVSILECNPSSHLTFRPDASMEHTAGIALNLVATVSQAVARTETALAPGVGAPYHLIFVRSNVGVRIIRYVPFDGSLNDESREAFRESRRRMCALTTMGNRARQLPTPFPDLFRRALVREVLTRRGMRGERAISLWTVAANALDRGAVMRISHASQRLAPLASNKSSRVEARVVGEFPANERGVATALLFEPAADDDSRLSLHIDSKSTGGFLSMKWNYLFEVARVPFAGALRDVTFGESDERSYLALATDSGLALYEISSAAGAQPVFSALDPDIQEIGWQQGACVVRKKECIEAYRPHRTTGAAQARAPHSYRLAKLRVQLATDERGETLSVARAAGFYLIWSKDRPFVSIFERLISADPDPLVEDDPADGARCD